MTAALARLAGAALALSLGLTAATAQEEQGSASDGLPGLDGGLGSDPAEEERAASIPGDTVELRGLDKLTGDVVDLTGAVGETIWLGRIEIKVEACYRSPSVRRPESSVFMQVYDTKLEPPESVFSGWMFASSPALSAMDHPRYDVWVLSCKTA